MHLKPYNLFILLILNPKYKTCEFPHAIMFHHFHNDFYPISQGSITKENLSKIIEFIGPKNILDAEEWLKKIQDNCLSPRDVCLTFDHGLKCQFDIALPVLKSYEITAFWFIYSSPIQLQKERAVRWRRKAESLTAGCESSERNESPT